MEWRHPLVTALRVTAVTLVLTGVVYPLVVTFAAQVLFHDRAEGSLMRGPDGTVLGSSLLAQAFTRPEYLWPRPSAAGKEGYDATASGGSNLGPTSAALADRVRTDADKLRSANPKARGPLPAELVTASASGLDPHVSPEAAHWQAPRIADARKLTVDRIDALIDAQTEGRDLGFLGEPRVNVLELNLELDRQFGVVPHPPAGTATK